MLYTTPRFSYLIIYIISIITFHHAPYLQQQLIRFLTGQHRDRLDVTDADLLAVNRVQSDRLNCTNIKRIKRLVYNLYVTNINRKKFISCV
jgi:hypothetical protein